MCWNTSNRNLKSLKKFTKQGKFIKKLVEPESEVDSKVAIQNVINF